MPDRPRDGAEVTAENLLARILVEADKRGLLDEPAKPTGKTVTPQGPRQLCGSVREFRKRQKLLLQQAEELESRTA